MSRVIFLDYDGVVNTPMWNDKGTTCKYNFPKDGKVNNFQAVQWLSEFCKKCHYDIVVSSSWRTDSNYKECLINGGLRDGIQILGKTPDFRGQQRRGSEIKSYLETHPEIKYYIIVDDIDDMLPEQEDHFVQTDESRGFGMMEYRKCIEIFLKDNGHKGSFWTKNKESSDGN